MIYALVTLGEKHLIEYVGSKNMGDIEQNEPSIKLLVLIDLCTTRTFFPLALSDKLI